MPTQPPIPPLLQPYLTPANSSLTLLTFTVGTTANWLVLRFIHAALKPNESEPSGSDKEGARKQDGESATKVVLVSWLRDAGWWHDGCKKLGLDIDRVTIIDGLSSGLGLGSSGSSDHAAVDETILAGISTATKNVTSNEQRSKIILILDGLDFLLAATAVPVLSLTDMILDLRENTQSVIITATADGPLTQSPAKPLEVNHATFVMRMAHQSNLIMSVRELNTGGAKDISGVLRITRGAGWCGDKRPEQDQQEAECLYLVHGDGGLKVFERGA